jgi:type IV secretion system protein TrbJ
MRKFLIAGVATVCLLFLAPVRSNALIVECANCSSIQEQLVSDAKQATQLATQLQQRATQLQQYQAQLTNMVTLPQSLWSQVQSDIMQVRNITNAASLLTGNSGTIISRLQSAQSTAGQALYLPANIGQQYTMWQQTLATASNSLGRTLGVQQGQEQNYAALQATINAHSQSAVGQMQAIQAGNELASLTSTQLNQIQTTLTAAAQQQATANIVTADRLRVEDNSMQQMLTPTAIPLTGYTGY